MAGRKVFSAGEVLQAADVNDFLMDQSVMVFAGTAARGSAIPSPSEGMVTYLQDADELQVYTTAWGAVGGGKVLQIVRATDTTARSTTSTSYTDVTGMSVTITPQKADSELLIVASFRANVAGSTSSQYSAVFAITDSSDVALSGAENARVSIAASAASGIGTVVSSQLLVVGRVTTGATSAVTYKLRFKAEAISGIVTAFAQNDLNTGQMYAIEVAA